MENFRPFFTISLDFELFWGMRDVTSIDLYGKNILGGREAIPKILDLFKQYHISSTWGVVGLTLLQHKNEIEQYLPSILPNYLDKNLSPYEHLKTIGKNEDEDPYHFGYSLLKKIQNTPRTEIASHSFSHFYCREERLNQDAFLSDLAASTAILNRYDIDPVSFIFCRNQYTKKDLEDLDTSGYKVFRGIENNKFSDPKAGSLIRAMRLADSYINFSGSNSFKPKLENKMVNVASSRFLRPHSNIDLQSFRIQRITSSMTKAAIEGKGYHLWWHPHNFGLNTQQNLNILREILVHFKHLKAKYNFESLTMHEASTLAK